MRPETPVAFDGPSLQPRRGPAPLLPKQLELVRNLDAKILLFRGGYRSGKTTGLVAKAIDLARHHYPLPCLAVEPTFPMIRSVFIETALRLCEKWKLHCTWNENKKILRVGRHHPAIIWCRSADARQTLEGLTVGSGVFDEWELYKLSILKVAMARVSLGPLQQIVLGGTPEGFGPGYNLVEKKPRKGTQVIVSPTRDNFTIRKGYVADMASRLTDEEIAEKLNGERSPPSNRVYTRFSRKLHVGKCCIFEPRRARLEMWCDFNVSPMAWGFVLVDGDDTAPDKYRFHVVGEIVVHGTDTERQAAEAVKWVRAWNVKHGRPENHEGMTAICDASSDARNAVAHLSHVSVLSDAGFNPTFSRRNPYVDDRVTSVQVALGGVNPVDPMRPWPVRLTFDESAAPYITSCISTQPRAKDGTPNKDPELGLDHGADLIGYGVIWHSPAYAPKANRIEQDRAEQWDRARGRR